MRTITARSKSLIRRITGVRRSPSRTAPSVLNQAVNFEKQTIFIAVPKTGTTSVRSQIRQEGVPLIPNPHLNIMQVRDSLYVYVLISALGRNRTFPSESIAEDTDLRARANKVFDTFFKFSGVRNPWARAVSLYFRREGVQLKDEMTFGDFCDRHLYASDTCRHPTLHKNQLNWLCDASGRCIMDYVYKMEDFDTAMREVEEQTDGRLQLVRKEANKNPSSLSQSYRELYTDKTRKIIAERFQKDIDYFKYTFWNTWSFLEFKCHFRNIA